MYQKKNENEFAKTKKKTKKIWHGRIEIKIM